MSLKGEKNVFFQKSLIVLGNWDGSDQAPVNKEKNKKDNPLFFEKQKRLWLQKAKKNDLLGLINLLSAGKREQPSYRNAYTVLCAHTLILLGYKNAAEELISALSIDNKMLPPSIGEELALVAYHLKRKKLLIKAFNSQPSSRIVIAYLIQSSLDNSDGSTALELLENFYVKKDLFYVNSSVFAYSMLGESALALSQIDECDFAAQHQELSKNRILMIINSGQLDSAIEAAKKYFDNWGSDLTIIKALSFSAENGKQNKQIGKFLSKIERENLSPAQLADFDYITLILKKPHLPIEKYVKQLITVNDQKFHSSKYDISQEFQFQGKLKRCFNSLKGMEKLDIVLEEKFFFTPIFIVGLPRSGTTILETMLLQDNDVTSVGESSRLASLIVELMDQDITASRLLELRDRYFLAFRKKKSLKGSKYVVDKMPHNFRFIPLIRKCFPEAKIILTQRDPIAVCLSNYETNFEPPGLGYSFDQKTLVQFYEHYSSIIKDFRNANEFQMIEWNYDDFIKKPSCKMKKLFGQLDLEWSDSFLTKYQNSQRIVSTASSMQVRKSINKDSSAKWKPYLEYLPELKNSLTQT